MKRTYDFGYRVRRKEWWQRKRLYTPHEELKEPLSPMHKYYIDKQIEEFQKLYKMVHEEHYHLIDHTMPFRLCRIVYDQRKGDE